VADDSAFIWNQPPRRRAPRPRRREPEPGPSLEGRIALREAERRFGVRVSTLRAWARKGSIDGVKDESDQWLVTPESVAHHLSRKQPRATAPTAEAASATTTTGPTEDGAAMLVPRDAWDRLMDQLGNLHEAGLHLAEARERAAKAETEATFLRERLAEMRTERDELKDLIGPPAPAPTRGNGSGWDEFRRRYGWLWGRRGS